MIRLFRFPYSCYAWKVQAALELSKIPFAVENVPYGDRSALLAVTHGYAHVPVVIKDDGGVLTESRRILEWICADVRGMKLAPPELEVAAWAYSDLCDSTLEDPLFRLACSGIRARFSTDNERAIFTLIKERKFGAGCIEAWAKDSTRLLAEGRHILAPSERALARHAFLLGAEPSLADASLYGLLTMCAWADTTIVPHLGGTFPAWIDRMRARGVSGS